MKALPCPFCGSTNVSVHEGETYRWLVAVCDDCGAQAPEVRKQTTGFGTEMQWMATGIHNAMKEWNKRLPASVFSGSTCNESSTSAN